MNLQDSLATAHVGKIHGDLPVEAARPEQSGVEHVRTVRRGDDDDALGGVEAIHLHKQCVEGLLPLVVATAEANTTTAAHGVDFINENEAGRAFARLLKHVAHPAGADTDEHLDEIRAADAEEGRLRLASDGLGQQGLARARSANHQNALGNAPAQPLKLFRVFEEFHQLADLVLGFLHPSNILEGGLVLVLGEHPRLALAEAHRAFAGHLQVADEHEVNKAGDDHEGQQADQHGPEQRVGLLGDEGPAAEELLHQLFRDGDLDAKRGFYLFAVRIEPRLAGTVRFHKGAADFAEVRSLWVVGHHPVADVVAFHLLDELGVAQHPHLHLVLVAEQDEDRDGPEDGQPDDPWPGTDFEVVVRLFLAAVWAAIGIRHC